MLSELRNRVKKAGQPPGTAVYTGNEGTIEPCITVIAYDAHNLHEISGASIEECFSKKETADFTWVHVEGLRNAAMIEEIALRYDLHPLTVEDILNVAQRGKIEEFDHYIFITLKMLLWNPDSLTFSIEQLSLILGKNFVLSFQERGNNIFESIYQKLRSSTKQRLREKGSDYLVYRLIDAVVDQYFFALEAVGDQIEKLEENIVLDPTAENARSIYSLKHKMLILRKAVWPMREVISHLLQADNELVTSFTRLYVRDAYDHIVQAIDTVETFRDMLASILDIYLSSLTNRMNEIMKVLTIIATIFIPITFIASVFGMNFKYMPELNWRWSYPCVLGCMLLIVLFMLNYFRRKKWL